MKLVNSKSILRKKYLSSILIFLAFFLVYTEANSFNVSQVLNRISQGDLSEKDILEFYKKDYDSFLENHQFFFPCLSHLIKEQKSKSESLLKKVFGNLSDLFNSNFKEMEVPELGIKIRCEVYVNKLVSKELRSNKFSEANLLNDSLDKCKNKLAAAYERLNNIKIDPIRNFNFKSIESGTNIGNKRIRTGQNIKNIEFPSKPDDKMFNSLIKTSNKIVIGNKSPSLNDELLEIKNKLIHLETEKKHCEKLLTEKTKFIYEKEKEINKLQQAFSRLNIEKIEKDKSLEECSNRKIECKADLDKCSIKIGFCSNNNCREWEKKLMSKIDEYTVCQKSSNDLSKKNTELNQEKMRLNIQNNSNELIIKDLTNKIDDSKKENQTLSKKFACLQEDLDNLNKNNCKETADCKKEVEKLKEENKNCKTTETIFPLKPITHTNCEEERQKDNIIIDSFNKKITELLNLINSKNKIIINYNYELTNLKVEINTLKIQISNNERIIKYEKDSCDYKKSTLETKINSLNQELNECKKNEFTNNPINTESSTDVEKDKNKYKIELEKCQVKYNKEMSDKKKCLFDLDESEKKLKIKTLDSNNCLTELKKSQNKINEYKDELFKCKEDSKKIKDACLKTVEDKIREVEDKFKVKIINLNNEIKNYITQINILKGDQDCPSNLKNCLDEKASFLNKVLNLEKENNELRDKTDKCENNIKIIQNNLNIIKAKEEVCNVNLVDMTSRWMNCENKKPIPCPTINDKDLSNCKFDKSKCNYELNKCKDDFKACKDREIILETSLKNCDKSDRCNDNSSKELDLCNKKIIKIQNTCKNQIDKNIERIKNLSNLVNKNDRESKQKLYELEENLKKQNEKLRTCQNKWEICNKNYSNVEESNTSNLKEIGYLKIELKNCQKKLECKEKNDESNESKVCEIARNNLLNETLKLKEKLSELKQQKKSIYASGKQIVYSLENKWYKDIFSDNLVLDDFERILQTFISLKFNMEGETSNNDIKIKSITKDISILNEQKNTISSFLSSDRNQYFKDSAEIKILYDKSKTIDDVNELKNSLNNIFVKEMQLKEDNMRIFSNLDKKLEIDSKIKIAEEKLNDLESKKNLTIKNTNTYKENLDKLNNVLKNFKINNEIKKTSISKEGLKIDEFANKKICNNLTIKNLEEERKLLLKNLQTLKLKIEHVDTTNNLLILKLNNREINNKIDINIDLLMRVFEKNLHFIDNNCQNLDVFKKRFYTECPMKPIIDPTSLKQNKNSKVMPIKNKLLPKKKKSRVINEFPLKSEDMMENNQTSNSILSGDNNKENIKSD